jgi:hypothetical protein
MPAITFMSWNIQTFGDQFTTRGNYAALCNFIARVAFNKGADILAIMELRSGGVAHLPTLAHALNITYGANADWYYDWIKGGVRTDINNNAIANAADLIFDADHHEGYAVFWNDDRNADFRMFGTGGAYSNGVQRGQVGQHPGRIPANVLNLVVEGRNPGALGNNGWFNAPDFDPVNPNQNWADLNFLNSNSNTIGNVARGGPRRPCYFVIELQNRQNPNNQPANNLVPILVFHATSNARSRQLNVQLSGYSRQLYRVDSNPPNAAWVTPDNVFIAGDFNIDANNREELVEYDSYQVFYHFLNAGGANCNPWLDVRSVDDDNQPDTPETTVQLDRPPVTGTSITSTNVQAYLNLAIDNIFYRLGANVNAVGPGVTQRVYNLLPEVINGNLIDGNGVLLISDFWNQVISPLLDDYPDIDPNTDTPAQPAQKRRRTGGTVNYESLIIGDIRNWTNFSTDLRLGAFTSARTAAEFIHKFISDHLPVTIQINFT